MWNVKIHAKKKKNNTGERHERQVFDTPFDLDYIIIEMQIKCKFYQ